GYRLKQAHHQDWAKATFPDYALAFTIAFSAHLTALFGQPKMAAIHDWAKHFALPRHRETRWRRHGRGVQGRRHQARPFGRPEIPAGRTGARPAGARTAATRGTRGVRSQPSEYLHYLRH